MARRWRTSSTTHDPTPSRLRPAGLSHLERRAWTPEVAGVHRSARLPRTTARALHAAARQQPPAAARQADARDARRGSPPDAACAPAWHPSGRLVLSNCRNRWFERQACWVTAPSSAWMPVYVRPYPDHHRSELTFHIQCRTALPAKRAARDEPPCRPCAVRRNLDTIRVCCRWVVLSARARPVSLAT